MKRFVLAAAIVGIAAFAGPTFAEPPHGDVYFAGHHHHHPAPYYVQPVVRYYPPRVRYYAPVVVAPPPVCAPPVAYGAYYPPVNSISVGGRNFGLNFTW